MLFYQTVDRSHRKQTVLNGPMGPAQVAETEHRPSVIVFIGIPVPFSRTADYNELVNSLISIIIPNRNGAATIGHCLDSIVSHADGHTEVIVVDDDSTDRSVEIIEKYPVQLIRLERHAGASVARNLGAQNSSGAVYFFMDADCQLRHDTLARVRRAVAEHGADAVIGGTYTPVPRDPAFFSLFQSVFINYFETKQPGAPDYVATHALAIDAATFKKSGGFPRDFLPILEDVEFSHRLRRAGRRLVMDPAIQVRHTFNFTLCGSLRNAFRKARYWTQYSLANKDLLADSGTASRELKVNVLSCFFCLAALGLWLITLKASFLSPLPMVVGVNLLINRQLIKAWYETRGTVFAFLASSYYTTFYAVAVGAGALRGLMEYFLK